MRDGAKKVKAKTIDFGKLESYRHAVLTMVSQENYVGAIDELKKYLASKPSYPQFKDRSERYVSYAIDLVNGIKAKKSFHGIHQLATSKQQELHDRALSHFEDLMITLIKVEQIEREVQLEDVRSTVWVVKALVHCTMAIVVMAFILEISKGVPQSAGIVLDHVFSDVTNWIFDHLGL